MTAEVVIMNKSAIALAADSAVTIQDQFNQKIYNSANKLFTLSKYHPIGIMIYDSATLLGVPAETIIKIYRESLGNNSFPTLEEYVENFITFLNKPPLPLFPEVTQIEFATSIIYQHFQMILNTIEDKVENHTFEHNTITIDQIVNISSDIINEHLSFLQKLDDLKELPKSFKNQIKSLLKDRIHEVIDLSFVKLPLPKKTISHLYEIASILFTKDMFSFPIPKTGIVIMGFGEKEIYPSLINFEVLTFLNKTLIYSQPQYSTVTEEHSSAIIPFAQRDMVDAFLRGISHQYESGLKHSINEMLEQYATILAKKIDKNFNGNSQKLIQTIKQDFGEVLNGIFDELDKNSNLNFVQPILDVVRILPKDQLAEMAENLVNITSFKRKVSMDAETVGGPIDVAVISKGDGFVWIKRKHYFTPDINPHFINKYFETVE